MPQVTTDQQYGSVVKSCREIFINKTKDYGEAWRDMSQESFVDMILSKILRIKQILQNEKKRSSVKALMQTISTASTMPRLH